MFLRVACTFLAVLSLRAKDAHVDVRFTPSSPSLSDTIRMEVTLSDADSSELALRPVDIPPDCAVVQSVQAQTVNGRVMRQILTLDPVKPGDCGIPPFQARCPQGTVGSCDVRSAETVIPIGTVVVRGAGPPDIRDTDERPVELHGAEKGAQAGGHIPSAAWLTLPFLAVAFAAFRIWRERRMDPALRAQRRLKQLRADTTPDSVLADAFAQLTGIFRDYLDERLAVGARSCTSPEIIETLRQRRLSVGSTTQVLETFLSASDYALFAGRLSGTADFNDAAEKCLTLVQVLEFDIVRRSRAGV